MTLSVKWIAGLSVGLSIVFCAAFVFFYGRIEKELPFYGSPKAIGKPLPEANLVDQNNVRVSNQTYRKGRTILVFLTPQCDACKTEALFLKTVVNRRSDVRFYGVVSFGEKNASLKVAEGLFPFSVFYDEGFQLAGQLGIRRVPIKIFVEDGIIKKAWGGATLNQRAMQDFVQWLDELK
jgi:peroxiredoxin